MKHTLFFIFSLLPAFLTNHQETVKTVTITADVHENLVSLDDITTSLGGTLTFNKETTNYTYLINEQEITLNLEFGYSLVNGEKEALLIETDEKTDLMTIQWQKPELIDEEIYVPIEYIERILGATYEDGDFTFSITEAHEDVTEEEEIEEVEITPNQPETNHSNSDQSSSNQGTTQSKPQQTPITPSQPESKPEDTKPSTPVEPESKPEDIKPSTPVEPEMTPEEEEPESEPIEPKPDDPVIEDNEADKEDTPSTDPENDTTSSENVSSDSLLENMESETTEPQNSSDIEIID